VPGTIIWDFDGTLAHCTGLWSGCLIEVLDREEPGHVLSREHVAPYLQDCFPWHMPDRPHLKLCDAAAWWSHVEGLLAAAYEGLGYSHARAAYLARLAHEHYLDPSRWQLFDDTLPVLRELREAGWRHVVLSNHVPELPALLATLGLVPLLAGAVTSAAIGYEKPHPLAFAAALDLAGEGGRVWMVGDNPIADVRGAEAAGIPGILVRGQSEEAARRAPDLWGVIPIVNRF
jgi:putative hydrolase of the HAD superfamily